MDKEKLKKQILEAIKQDPLSKGSIQKAFLFGSFLREAQSVDSDVDILIELKSDVPVGLFTLARIQRELSRLTGRKIDLLTPQALSKFFRDEVLNEAELIYEEKG